MPASLVSLGGRLVIERVQDQNGEQMSRMSREAVLRLSWRDSEKRVNPDQLAFPIFVVFDLSLLD
jgi:hypothetical protein